MNEKPAVVFVDDSGCPSLNLGVEGVTRYFVVAATIVEQSKLDAVRAVADSIRIRCFGSGEMKSSGIGNNLHRRLKVLNEFRKLDVSSYVFIVDKQEIKKSSGLIYKKPFLKFLSGKLYRTLFRTFRDLNVFADEHGTVEFMEEFKKYMLNHHVPDLFSKPTFSFSKSVDDPLVQVSDVIAGSYRCFSEPGLSDAERGRLIEEIRSTNMIVKCERWPLSGGGSLVGSYGIGSSGHDSIVENYCKNAVEIYLSEKIDESDEGMAREEALKYLAQQSSDSDNPRYISCAEISSHLSQSGYSEFSELHTIRTKIIAHFRDSDVIIASNQSGYRIPSCVDDIVSYAKRCDNVIVPMLKRLSAAHQQLKMVSHNNLDFLSESGFSDLKKAVASVAPGVS